MSGQRFLARQLAALLCLAACVQAAWSLEVIAEGRATIGPGGVAEAREQALRQALGRAAEQQGAWISIDTSVSNGVASEAVRLQAQACTGNTRILSENISGAILNLVVQTDVQPGQTCQPVCQRNHHYTQRILVTGFALEFPEQRLPEETAILSRTTAVELSKKIVRRGKALSEHNGAAFPYASPTRAPEAAMRVQDEESPFAVLARNTRSQYVLSGIYRDLGMQQDHPLATASRRIEIEAFLHDGASGELLGRQTFVGQATGKVLVTRKPVIGSADFYQGDFGRAWGEVLERIAAWGEAQTACLPFIARVLQAKGNLVHIDAGAEAGLSPGDSLSLHQWRNPVIASATGISLGREKSVRAKGLIRHVYPRFAVIELSETVGKFAAEAGDILYAQ